MKTTRSLFAGQPGTQRPINRNTSASKSVLRRWLSLADGDVGIISECLSKKWGFLTPAYNMLFALNALQICSTAAAAIVLTMDSNGSIYTDTNQRINQGIVPTKAVDTTAAGDTFNGNLLQAVWQKNRLVMHSKLQLRRPPLRLVVRGQCVRCHGSKKHRSCLIYK